MNAQIAVQPATPNALVDKIVGTGIRISNVNLNCPNNASAIFTGGDIINEGVILTTGNANNAPGPNNSVNTSTNHGASGDSELDNITGGFYTFDACVLEFDIIPFCDQLDFSFLFASEEYPEYVGQAFNDVFGIFITGPNPIDPLNPYADSNLATIGGNPINVNSVNNMSNAAYYLDNTTNNLEYDGHTTEIMKTIDVTTCASYHIKIAIADGDDGIFDAALLINQNSFDCGLGLSSSYQQLNIREGCVDTLTLTRANVAQADTIPLLFIGTAINGIDASLIPDTIYYPVGVADINLPIEPLKDGVFEGVETMRIVYPNGPCGFFDTVDIRISDELNISAGNDINVCSDVSVQIGSTPLAIPGITYNWMPNTGINNPNQSNPILTRTNAGPQSINQVYYLEATLNGCVYEDSMTVTVNANPTSSFNTIYSCSNDTSYFFSTSGDSLNEIWDFGDTYFGYGDSVGHVYGLTGTYNVELVVIDTNMCRDTSIQPITLYSSPVANFNFTNVCKDYQTCMNDLSTIATGNITGWDWDFANLFAVTTQNPCVTYPTAGIYPVKLKVTSDQGCQDSITRNLTIYNTPFVNFTSQNNCTNDSILFTNYSSSTSGFISSYQWNFGDGSTQTIRNPKNFYPTAGNYNVRLVVTTSNGCIDSSSLPITIYEAPIVDFAASSTQGCESECIDFINQSPANQTYNYLEWDFGDGIFANDSNPEHCYLDTGSYTVSLTIRNTDGCEASETKIKYITIHPVPDAYFEVNKNVLDGLNPVVRIEDGSSNDVVNYLWDLGDSTVDSSNNRGPITHTYLDVGTYFINLEVTNNFGCKDEFGLNIFIKENIEVFLSNAFTPDGDGKNDTYGVEGFNLEAISDFKFLIFNRWGRVIYETDRYDKPWDGTHNNKPCKQDVYVYRLVYASEDGEEIEHIGTVTLLR